MEPLEFFSYILGANAFYVVIMMFVTRSRDYKELLGKINENMPLYFIFFVLINLFIWFFGFVELPILWSISGLVVISIIGACIFIPSKKRKKSLRELLIEGTRKKEKGHV